MALAVCEIHSLVAGTDVPGREKLICAGFREIVPSRCFYTGTGMVDDPEFRQHAL